MSSASPIGPVDPVQPIPAAQLLTIAGTVDAAIASLDPGTLLTASVVSASDKSATIRVGGQLLQARSETSLAAGERMLLRVDQAGSDVILRRVDTPAAPSSPFQGARLTVPAAPLETAVAEIYRTASAPALPLATVELPSLPGQAADLLPAETPVPATAAGTTLTVAGQQIELPEALPVPDGASVQVTATTLPSGRIQLTISPPLPPAAAPTASALAPAPTARPTTAAPAVPAPPSAASLAPSGAGLAAGRSFPAIAVVSDGGAWLQAGDRLIPAEPAAPLPAAALPEPGTTLALPVNARVVSLQSGRAEVLLSAPAATAGSLVAERGTPPAAGALAVSLASVLGAQAPAVAALLTTRGAPPNAEETKLAARMLAGEQSPVDLLRSLAAMFPPIAQQVQAIESDATAGSGKRLRQALSRLGLDTEAAALRSTDSTPAAPTVKEMTPPATTLVAAQQLLVAQPPAELATSYFFLPLPENGKAEIAVERSKDALHVRGELSMTALGDIGFHLTSHEQGVYAQIDAAAQPVAAHLEQSVADLRAALEKASGKPAVVTVAHRPPRSILPALPPPLNEGRLA